jgi:hypothetical protein
VAGSELIMWLIGSECTARQRSSNRRGSATCIEAGASIKAIKPKPTYLWGCGRHNPPGVPLGECVFCVFTRVPHAETDLDVEH